MKYIVLDSFKAQTRHGETELQAGQIITIPDEIAIGLLNSGRITPIEPDAPFCYWQDRGIKDCQLPCFKIVLGETVSECFYFHEYWQQLEEAIKK